VSRSLGDVPTATGAVPRAEAPGSLRAAALPLAIILAVAAALRVAAAIMLPNQHLSDAEIYRLLAQHIWTLHSFDSSDRMPLYPLIVAVVGTGWSQRLFDIALSTVTVWLLCDLTWVMFRDRRAALLAGAMAAVYPYFIFYAVIGLTETLFMTLMVVAFAAWYRGAFTRAATFTALSILTRPIIDLLPPFLIFYFALVVRRLPLRGALRQLGVYVLIYVALLTPWWIHNYNAYGTFVRLNLGSGLALYSGNNARNQSGGVSDVDLDTSQFDRIADPIARDRAARDAALAYIEADPVRFLKLAELKFLRFWRLYPFAEPYRSNLYVIASLLSFAPVLLLAVAFVLSCGFATLVNVVPLIMFAAYLTAVHVITVGSTRYRLPIEPFLIVLAAPMLSRLYDAAQRRLAGVQRAWKA